MHTKNEFKTSRRKFLASAGLLGIAGFVPFPGLAKSRKTESSNNLTILKTGPYIQLSGKKAITVSWITNKPCFGWVEFGEDANNLLQIAKTTNAGLVEANNTIHTITIQNLNPGKIYYYRIYSKEIKTFDPYNIVFGQTYSTEIYSFKMADKFQDSVSFLVFNDIHDRPESIRQLLQYQTIGNKDFILLNGDILGHLDDEDQLVHNLFEPLSEVSSNTPIVFSRGNHEARGKFARQLTKYFNRKNNAFYFSFIIGQVYFIVLDSGEDKFDTDKEYFGLVDFDPY